MIAPPNGLELSKILRSLQGEVPCSVREAAGPAMLTFEFDGTPQLARSVEDPGDLPGLQRVVGRAEMPFGKTMELR